MTSKFCSTSTTVKYSHQIMSNPKMDDCNVPDPFTYRILAWVMIVEFILSLPLNLSVLYIFIFRFKFWKNKSIFLLNIVIADFLLVACLPAKSYYYFHRLRRSEDFAACKAMLFMLFLNRGASIAFLITLSIDRYFNVVHLGKNNLVKCLKKTPQISIVIWLLLLPLTIPILVNDFDCCNSAGRQNNTIATTVTDTLREVVFFSQILIPFLILIYCSVRIVNRLRRKTVGEKRKLRRAVWVVMSVVAVFSICFLPCAVARASLLAVRLIKLEETETVVVQVYDSLMVLSYMDCLLDPLVYCFCNSGFKNAYISTFCPAFLRERLLDYDQGLRKDTITTMPVSVSRDISLAMSSNCTM